MQLWKGPPGPRALPAQQPQPLVPPPCQQQPLPVWRTSPRIRGNALEKEFKAVRDEVGTRMNQLQGGFESRFKEIMSAIQDLAADKKQKTTA